MDAPAPGGTDGTKIKRLPERSVSDRSVLHAILDGARVAHVGIVDEQGQPFVLPVACARDGESLLLHGSSASRLFRTLARGIPVCATVTHVDGLVLARSAFESSMNYRSVMALGVAALLEGQDKRHALDIITEHLLPGRQADLRPMRPQEEKATAVARLPLDECSVKVRQGGPDDPPEDLGLAIWAGVLPIQTSFGQPIPDPSMPPGVPIPDYLNDWQ
jgi:uncharacterized protein